MGNRTNEDTTRTRKTDKEDTKVNGFIAVHRKIYDNTIIKPRRPYSRFEAFMWLLIKANYSDNKFELGGEVIKAERGEVITSQKKLQAKFGWGNTRVRNFLKILQSDQMVTIKPTTQLTRITICNYESYQIEQTANKPRANRKQIDSKPIATTKNKVNKNNKKNNNNISENFKLEIFTEQNIVKYGNPMLDEFWLFYSEPTQDGKKLKYQTFQTWSTSGRLATWSKKDFNGHYQAHKNRMAEIKKQQEQRKARANEDVDPEGQAKYMNKIKKQLANKMRIA